MAHPSIKVANELLALHGDIDHMKLQKLLYYANGWWLAINGRPLLNENPQVWRYGPVYRWLYGVLARFGHDNIGGPVAAGPFVGGAAQNLDGAPDADYVRQMLDFIWKEHGHKTAIQLSDETHASGTPWRTIAEQYNFKVPQGMEIPPKLDWEYFSKLATARGVSTKPLAA